VVNHGQFAKLTKFMKSHLQIVFEYLC